MILVFSTTESIVSKVIRWTTKCPASHASLTYYDPKLGIFLVVDTNQDGVSLKKFSSFKKKNRIVRLVPLRPVMSESQAHDCLMYVGQKLGRPYDYLGIFGVAVWYLKKWLGLDVSVVLNSPRSLFCSELVAEALSKSGVIDIDPVVATPKSLWDAFEGN